ncbi:hypothetical protein SAMN05421788_101105 [Filimonas lacunae]|uniref:Lipocalin-like domain-containing protein n=1 Tax=Filimonas lacunae TaxID=477680 RepID=A0A173MMD3_9BACT|nr:hypothetical protein [Filimonas lacunae]BAV08646.1 hypothetical protein FLA_4693 [Filimonas lacunae]SIS59141.1 hypothetical protein SAMN05421788_101105 [Filimonas lacunae]
MHNKRIITLTTLFIIVSAFQDIASTKKLIVGSWIFEKFDFPNYISPNSEEARNANKTNKGLVVTFTADNQFISSQPGGIKANNAHHVYRLLKDGKHLVIGSTKAGDTLEIDKVDAFHLVLYSEGRPGIYFSRKPAH